MASLKELRQRKRSITSIHKLTSAMKMVSRAKFMKHQVQWKDSLVSLGHITSLAGRLYTQKHMSKHLPFYMHSPSEDKPTLLVVFAADKGLCGGFNVRLLKAAHHFVKTHTRAVHLICVGQKAAASFAHATGLVHTYTHLSGTYDDMVDLIGKIETLYRQGDIHDCVFLYNHFRNALLQEPVFKTLLPIALEEHKEGGIIEGGLLEYAPSFDAVLEETLGLLFRTQTYTIFKEHLVSEYSARMAAMEAATDNAETMMRKLDLEYNRLRQSLITTELIEIISGAEAL